MADKTNLDKQIEAALKANLNSIRASDDLIAKTLARLEETKKATVTPMPVKKKRLPIAVISTIAASAIALAGGIFLFTSITSNSKTASENATAIEAVDQMTKNEEAIFDVASEEVEAEIYVDSVDSISFDDNDTDGVKDSLSLSSSHTQKKTTLSLNTYSDISFYLNVTPSYKEIKNPYYRNNPGMVTAPSEENVDQFNLNIKEKDNRILSKMQNHPYFK